MATQPSSLPTTPPTFALSEMVENVGNDPTTSHYLCFDNHFFLLSEDCVCI